MVGKKFTYLVGSEASALLFNSKNEDLNAEDVYGKLVTPVFGKGVAYDVPNDVRCSCNHINPIEILNQVFILALLVVVRPLVWSHVSLITVRGQRSI